jgi:CubicO group peptidase (beta-lactamase class C family)
MTRFTRRRVLTVATLGALGGCGGVYTPGYILRTLTRQDANTDDFLWKDSIRIPASTSPRSIPTDLSRAAMVEEALVRALGNEPAGQFMARTNTQSLQVLRGGVLQFERYAPGVTANSLQSVFSVSKSVLSLLVGQALTHGYFQSLDDPITRYLPELAERDRRFNQITLGNLLDMRSGIAFSDDLRFPFVTNDAPLVYYASDLRAVVLTRTRIEAAPGTFTYNDYNPNLVALALERAAGAGRLVQMRAQLWSALGAEDDAQWSTDGQGFPYWESGLVATPRDLAKLGLIVLQPREAQSLLSQQWLARISTASVPADMAEFNGRQWSYRAGWWLILRADGRHDIAAIGRFGQMVYASPANDVLIVRTGRDENAPEDGELTALFFAMSSALGERN